MKVVVASAIFSVAAIFSAAMISGNIDFKTQNILRTDSGHVNLGKIYSEQGLLDVEVKFLDGKTQAFALENISRRSFQDSVDDKIQSLIDEFNQGKADDEKLTKETLSFKKPYSMTLTAHTLYMAEHIPTYNLILDKKEIPFKENTLVYKSISDSIAQFIKDNNKLYDESYFIKAN